MPDIALPYAYPATTTLNTDEHNKNMYSSTNTEGLISTPNGDLENANLAGSFRLRADMIQPGQMVHTRNYASEQSFDFYSNAFPDHADAAGTAADENLVATQLGDFALRIRVPYQMPFALWQWQMYMSWYVPQVSVLVAGGSAVYARGTIFFKVFIDGTAVQHTYRELPTSAVVVDAANNGMVYYESLAAQWYSMRTHSVNLTKGWHDISIRAGIQRSVQKDVIIHRTINNIATTNEHTIFQRLTMGVHNVAVIG